MPLLRGWLPIPCGDHPRNQWAGQRRVALTVQRALGPGLLALESVEHPTPLHRKQIQTYLRLTGRKLGPLRNLGAALMQDGMVFCVNALDA